MNLFENKNWGAIFPHHSLLPTKISKINSLFILGLPSQVFQTLQQMQRHNASKVNSETDLSMELKKIASDKGLVISDNQGSGNCLFNALSEQLELVKGIRISHKELRRVTVKYIRENPQTVSLIACRNYIYFRQICGYHLVYEVFDSGLTGVSRLV